MVGETPNYDYLLPERHPQLDLFVCDVADAVLKDVIPQMEHPFYSLSKKPETQIRRYEHNGNWLEVIPSVKGLATIYDKDILIYCISQLMAKLQRKEPVSRRVRINSRDLLMFTNRGTAGKDYKALSEALDRLRGTTISTNIRSGDEEEHSSFSLIDAATVRRKLGLDGRLLWCEVTISQWVFDAIENMAVLTLHRDYFRLRKPIERRVYELARKHCGQQRKWKIGLELLHKKSGSRSSLKEFRRALRTLVKGNHLPDYHIDFDEESDQVLFENRDTMETGPLPCSTAGALLSPETYERARSVAPGYDVYFLEQEWRTWWASSGSPTLKDPDRAFLGFCRKRHEKQPLP